VLVGTVLICFACEQGTADSLNVAEPLPALFEDHEDANSPPQPTLSQRAKSYSDFYDIVRSQLPSHGPRKKRERRRSGRGWEGLALPDSVTARLPAEKEVPDDGLERELLQASQQEYLCVGNREIQSSPTSLPGMLTNCKAVPR
jgi:hypothetical protein